MSGVADALIQAIYGDRLAEAVDADVGEPDGLVGAADATMRTIAAVATRCADDVERALTAASIGVQVEPIPDRQQRPVVSIRIDPESFSRARDVLGAAGYEPIDRFSPGAWESYRRIKGSARLTSTGRDGAQVVVTWGPDAGAPNTRWQAIVRPGPDQWVGTDLPGWAWPAYRGVRLYDLAHRRIRGAGRVRYLGPHLPTPVDLVEPVLRWAGVGPADVLLDVGSGDGRVLIEAARTIGCRGLGVERDALLAHRSVRAAQAAGVGHLVTIVSGELADTPVDDATAAFVFLPSGTAGRAIRGLDATLPAGSTIVAHEQSRLRDAPEPDDQAPIFAAAALTVAHRWTASGDPRSAELG